MKHRSIAYVLAILMVLSTVSLSHGYSQSTMKRMGIFLSNFTEQGMYNFNAKDVLNENNPRQMIEFGIWHNYINNFKSKIRQSGNKLSIDGKFVKETIKKYFNYNIKRLVSVGRFHYDGRKFTFDGADGEATYYCRVTSAKKIANGVIEMKGYLYNVDDHSDRNGTFVALAKPYKYGGKNTWSIISLKHRQ